MSGRPDFFANRPAHFEQAVPIGEFIRQSSGRSDAYVVKTPAGASERYRCTACGEP
ncbi:MAG: hypothetical protein IPG20_14230 [Gammaproteobacteria bacterium]|jgi:hypothetical protein|nr:hypothetical protein [Gammaproteobacteria bacterium]MBK9665236.1 hypothetical protein [Gammaproteobacteria bacterium]